MKTGIGTIYNGLIWSSLCTLLCVRSVIICMNINIGFLFLIFCAVFMIGISAWCKWKRRSLGIRFTMGNLFVSSVLVYVVYRFFYHQNLLEKPAFIVRQALRDRSIPMMLVNQGVILVLVAGMICMIAAELYDKKK